MQIIKTTSIFYELPITPRALKAINYAIDILDLPMLKSQFVSKSVYHIGQTLRALSDYFRTA